MRCILVVFHEKIVDGNVIKKFMVGLIVFVLVFCCLYGFGRFSS